MALFAPEPMQDVPNYSAAEVDRHIEFSRRVVLANEGAITLGKDLSITAIGKDRLTPAEFAQKVQDVYQRGVNVGSDLAESRFKEGKLYVPYEYFSDRDIAEKIAKGNYIDRFAKDDVRTFLERQRVPEGIFSIVSLGRRFSAAGAPLDYRMPDVLIRYSTTDIYALDATIGTKTASTPQVRDTLRYGAQSWTNISPYAPATTIFKSHGTGGRR